MKEANAVEMFKALGQKHRMQLFRQLVKAVPDGLTAGDLSQRVGLPPSGLSFHLSQLEAAGLVNAVRSGRQIHYAPNIPVIGWLMDFLGDECCGGQPELCAPHWTRIGTSEDKPAMTDQNYNVLFLCTGNSARSIIAEAILKREGRGRFNAWSAGSQPSGQVHPYAADLLRNLNHDISDARSKNWDEFAAPDAPEMHFVFTVCDNAANEVCPVWPGQPMSAHWGIPDPAAVEGSEAVKRQAFADAYRMMNNRISIFINLPLASLDRLALQKRLDDIGKTRAEA